MTKIFQSKKSILLTGILVILVVIGVVYSVRMVRGFCVKGNCENGFGIKKYYDGSRYIGQWKESKQNGNGVLVSGEGKILSSGIWKEGEFTNEKIYRSSKK